MKTLVSVLAILSGIGAALADEAEFQFRVTSFFIPEREATVREAFESIHESLEVVDLDFETAVATLRFDPAVVVERAGDNEENQRALLSQMLRGSTRGVVDVLPISAVPNEQIEEVVIPVAGLDCIGCSYAAYEAVRRVEGVEYAIASFRDGRVLARFDREKTSEEQLLAELMKKRIPLNYQIDEPNLVPRNELSVVRVSSEELRAQGDAVHAIDGDPQTKWETRWQGGDVAQPPHEIVIDLGKSRQLTGFRYLARQLGSVGAFAKTEFFISESADEFGDEPAAAATFIDVKKSQTVDCDQPVTGRYVLIRMLTEIEGRPNGTAAEFGFIERKPD